MQGGKKFIPLIIVLIIVQFCALVWCVVHMALLAMLTTEFFTAFCDSAWRRYTASYIPFARAMIASCLGSCFKG